MREAKDSLTDSLLSLRDSLLAESMRSAALGRGALAEAKAMKSASLRHMAREISMPWSKGRLASFALSEESKRGKYGAWAPVLAFSVAEGRRIRKSWAGKKTADERALAAYREMKRRGSIEGGKKAANSESGRAEGIMKGESASIGIAAARAQPIPSPFWIVSWHGDCAEDHEEWQGRLYYDEKWRSFVKGSAERAAVESIISSKGMKSLQWAMGRPVWLITRPNCRHYAEPVTIDEASSSTEWGILSSRRMAHEIGPRGGRQTIRHSTGRGWYTEGNVESIIRQYEERLRALLAMAEQAKGLPMTMQEIARDVNKTRMLISKWKSFLKQMVNGG